MGVPDPDARRTTTKRTKETDTETDSACPTVRVQQAHIQSRKHMMGVSPEIEQAVLGTTQIIPRAPHFPTLPSMARLPLTISCPCLLPLPPSPLGNRVLVLVLFPVLARPGASGRHLRPVMPLTNARTYDMTHRQTASLPTPRHARLCLLRHACRCCCRRGMHAAAASAASQEHASAAQTEPPCDRVPSPMMLLLMLLMRPLQHRRSPAAAAAATITTQRERRERRREGRRGRRKRSAVRGAPERRSRRRGVGMMMMMCVRLCVDVSRLCVQRGGCRRHAKRPRPRSCCGSGRTSRHEPRGGRRGSCCPSCCSCSSRRRRIAGDDRSSSNERPHCTEPLDLLLLAWRAEQQRPLRRHDLERVFPRRAVLLVPRV